MVEKFEYKNEIYYYLNKKFTDSSFIILNKTLNNEIGEHYFSKVNYKSLPSKELIDFIKEIKQNELYNLSIMVCEFGLVKYESDEVFIKVILPILTSSYRLNYQPSKVISLATKFLHNKKYQSVPLLTSVAAAYCDISDYKSAKKTADYAYRLQNGSLGYENELSLVYKRINKYLNN
ncbi:MAG: hypothetical protein PHO06_02760 [Clostridia bacterium]|nr:hypothetical protein [Clostridia bacterium]MDD4408589.1 hypothetical protein [Clostridia bacterium]